MGMMDAGNKRDMAMSKPEGVTPPTDAQAGDASGMLSQIEQNIESKLQPDLKKEYLSIVVAGRQLMFSDKTHQMMEEYMGGIKSPEQVPNIVAHGIVKLMALLFDQSQGKLSIPASAPAAITLMTYALKYVDGQLNIEVTKPMIDQATTATITGLFALWKVDPKQIQDAIAKAGQQAPPEGSAQAEEEA